MGSVVRRLASVLVIACLVAAVAPAVAVAASLPTLTLAKTSAVFDTFEASPHLTQPGWVPSPIDYSHLRTAAPSGGGPSVQAVLPAVYDLRSLGRLTAVRDQDVYPICWAFASYSSLESALMPAEASDFSEDHMALANLCDGHTNYAGGNFDIATSYLARWAGPVAETEDPLGSIYPPEYATTLKHVQDADYLAPLSNVTSDSVQVQTDPIKQAVVSVGAVAVDMAWDPGYFNAGTNAYYLDKSATPNHGVAVVGWNDGYSRFNFKTAAPGNGAFIVRNSWGPGWGEAGYFYVSYYDAVFAHSAPVAFHRPDPVTRFDKQFGYDTLGATNYAGFGTDTAWFKARYTTEATRAVNAVAFYAGAAGSTYHLFKSRGAWLEPVGSGTVSQAGYHTVSLDTTMNTVPGQTFDVAVQLTTPGFTYPIPLEYRFPGYSSAATAGANQTYVSPDGSNWYDLTDFGGFLSSSVCLKAFSGTNAVTLRKVTSVRTSGSDRYATAVAISKKSFPHTAPAVVIAQGENFPDALAAGPLAKAYGGPVLLTPPGALPGVVLAELRRLAPTQVFIAGGTKSVSSYVASQIAAIPSRPSIKRFEGVDRFDTAGLIADWVKAKTGSTEVALVPAYDYHDAVIASAYASAKGWPVLLSAGTDLPARTAAAYDRLDPATTLVVADLREIPMSATASLPGYVYRIGKSDHYENAVALLEYAEFNDGPVAHVALATGGTFPDALAAAPYLAADGGLLLFASPGTLPLATNLGLAKNYQAIDTLDILGGVPSISAKVAGDALWIVR